MGIHVKDIYSTSNGIFKDLKDADTTDFNLYFGTIDTDILDVMYIAKAASKTISPIVENYVTFENGVPVLSNEGRVILAKTIWATYGYQWAKSFEALNTEFNAMDSSNYQLTTTEEISGTNSNTDTSSDTNAVYGFDSDDSVNDNAGNHTATSNGATTSSRTTTVTKSGKDGGYTYGTLLDNALKAAKNSFNSIAVSNVVNFTTIDIYD